ncbi:MAG TPA: TVP38/TMEM64 family protein [Candidatus Polarisedimenticolia bacterium]|nr:TVP38/TMEM64 family protein [Candidatus Polarisedimenticolia bacterium]
MSTVVDGPPRDGRTGARRMALLLALAAALFIAARVLPIGAWLASLNGLFTRLGPWGIVLFVLVYALAAVLFVPGSPLTVGAGLVYGLGPGFAAASAGSTLGAACAFLVARYLARDRVERWVGGDPRFRAIDEAVGREGWTIVLLTRLSPVFPFNLLNYLYGLTRVPFHTYLPASWIGMMPGTLLYVYLGFAGRTVAQAATAGLARSPAEYAFWATGLLATIAVTLYVTRLARRALHSRAGWSAG